MFVIFFLISVIAAQNDSVNNYIASDTELHSLEHWRISFTDTVPASETGWLAYYSNDIDKDHEGIRKFKTRIILKDSFQNQEQLGLYFLSSYSAYDVYWDNVLLGKNGSIANGREKEIPGNYVRILRIPVELTGKGEHTLLLKLSNFSTSYHSLSLNASYLGKISAIRGIESRESFRLGFVASLYLLAALLCFILYGNGGKFKPYLRFSGFCIASLFLVSGELLMYHYYINNASMPYVDAVMALSIFLKYFSLYYFIVAFFDLKKFPLLFLSLLVLLKTFFPGFLFYFAIISCLLITVYAYSRGKKNAMPLIWGSGIYLVISILSNYRIIDHEYSFGAVILIISIFYLIGMSAGELELEKERSLLRTERLENELLKKSIQPHFINNTLLSVINWIKKEPATAVEMIHALSEEFDYIISFSKEKQIRIEDEIILCQKHLFIMSRRKEQTFNLDIKNTVGNFLFPPLILHTLIENCISHLPAEKKGVMIFLSISKNRETICLELRSPTVNESKPKQKDGIGYTYIKTRLTEVYGDNWNFSQDHDQDFWVEKIWIKNETNCNS